MGAGPMGLEVRAPVWRSRRGETESGSSRAKKVEPVMEIRAALLTCSHKRPLLLLLLPLPCSADSLFIPSPHIFWLPQLTQVVLLTPSSNFPTRPDLDLDMTIQPRPCLEFCPGWANIDECCSSIRLSMPDSTQLRARRT